MDKKANRTVASLRISNDVLTKIAEVAATEIRGVASEGEHLVVSDKNIAQITGKIMTPSPVKAVLKNDAVEVTVNIVVLQGFKAENVAQSVQESIKSAIQNMAGISVSKVNVKIADIMLSKSAE
ncbi:MAG: Asp23/Gls24 family envelope stress response protein [Ruminiclostridium sp.]|nr:Asp23/Gls24 family envelope stress response protein [Ruminiclostridium sp.]